GDEAIAVAEAAWAAAPEDFDQRAALLVNLAAAYYRRYLHRGDLADLSLAVMHGQEALDAAPQGHATRIQALTVAASALLALADRSGPGQQDQRDAGLRYLLEAGTTRQPGEDQAETLARMAQALVRVYHAGGDRDALDHGIDAWRRVVAETPEQHPDYPEHVAGLARAVRERYDRDGTAADLDLAISGFRVVASGEPDSPFAVFDLGSALERRYRATGEVADAREAIEVWRAAAGAVWAGADRMPSARAWGELATVLGEAGTGLAGYEIAVELLPQEAWRGLDRADRERHLRTWTRLGTDAAACAVSAGRPERGLELLEASRAVLWAQRDEVRADLGPLAATRPELAERLSRLRDEYEHDRDPATVRDLGDRILWDRDLVQRRTRRAQQWDAAVAEVRALPGHAGFLAPPDFASLAAAATGGPVLVVNGSRHRCDVLAVTVDGVRVVPLPDAPLAEVRSRAAAYTDQMVEYQAGRRGLAARVRLESHVSGLLSWLWDAVAGPVLAALGYHGPPGTGAPWPRVWWSPTDAFAALPLHAAGHPDSTVDAVPERVVSSYAPTVRSLAGSAADAWPAGPHRLLVVAVPDAAGLPPLPYVMREADVLRGLYPDRHTALLGPQATAERVREQLPRHDWIHLACHGGQRADDPVMGALHLSSGSLTVTDLGWTDLAAMQFAYLSACRTATGTMNLLDEAIHPAAALRVAGCRHVVAAMWAVSDDTAVEVVSEVYGTLTAADRPPGSGIAEVLHRTVRRMRAEDPHAPTRWIPFIHLGP
ncbi:MAG TPA: CHAT domain-containing protein, partial [Rugosimonospora sp.]|nr:CHAT domain-containing protein [Rugosimonospora sp.]